MASSRIPAIYRAMFSHEMMPTTEMGFYDSEWNEWLSRIDAGLKSERERLEELADGADEEYAEVLAEDFWVAKNISDNMYAALIVSIWAKIERFFRLLCRYCTHFGLPPIDNNANIVTFATYFGGNLGIRLISVTDSQTANAIRVLSNSYKHNDCHYIPDSYPIDGLLLEQYGIAVYQPHTNSEIEYTKLPIKEMVLAAGSFCKELLANTEAVLKAKTQNDS